jgi:hypothetical protein
MSEHDIKSAQEVISDFVKSLSDDASLDAETVAVITDLYGEDKLSKTNLLRELESRRSATLVPDPQPLSKGNTPDD